MSFWQEEVENWSYEHFVLFVYLHIALADNEIIDTEWQAMRRRFERFDSPRSFEEVFNAVMYVYRNCNDVQVLEVIEYFRERHAQSPAARAQLLRDVQEIAQVDQGLNAEEVSIQLQLRHLLE